MKAITEVFPSTNLQGCHFHFVQSLYRNFGSLMKKEYDSNYSFALFMKSIFGLPFVHIDDVRQAFDLIVESSTFTDGLDVELDSFFQYLYRNYVGDEYHHLNLRQNFGMFTIERKRICLEQIIP